ncbi:MAG TPA: hypothetical protein VH740_15750 [Vicinamibacterales bacterium]|jgi:hypothetical protein
MRGGLRSFTAAVFVLAPFVTFAQVNLQPTPPPTVTAEERDWYLAREPIVFAGSLYYPGGPQIYFNRNEMIRSGYYDWVPLYTRTTLEPYSILFVPVAGGLMQPYERRRSGELAGTAGSTAPSFPISRPGYLAELSSEWSGIPQAAGPPSSLAPSYGNVSPQPAPTIGLVRETSRAEAPAPTTGFVGPVAPGVFRSAEKPEGLNGIFIEHAGKRWFNNGPARTFNPDELVSAGTYRGTPVYMKPGDDTTIYVPVAESAGSLLTPYAQARLKRR